MTALTFEATSRRLTVAGVDLHLHEAGSGPLLLLIHGGAPGAYGWGNFGQNLPALAASYRTVIVDLPGYGRSERLPECAAPSGRYAANAAVFAELVCELGETSAHVVGLATGGAIAMAMALDHPEVVDRLVLVSSAGALPLFTPSPSEGQKLIRTYYAGEGPSRDKMRAYLTMMLADPDLITDELVEERYQASLTKVDDIGSPEQLWARVDEITAKTLVMWGRDNRVQGYDNALFLLQRIPDVEVHLFGRTGLWVPFERAARFESLLIDFLEDQS
ncbi:alpha/beta fold hydrolase [Nocardioides sp. Kera G14]|uniref:alpha/beta fold hydrolase n=1 Tax=Nocardioides sp. Kera G14 TaxID=2884264 RepID=UPI001D11FCE9|nr:alpha/beta fold hydrolase [Nocardioides sp. Kera G14]UDY24593.1 alpha/beta fold hydrolase [Nocardioides sp. Kera G14]